MKIKKKNELPEIKGDKHQLPAVDPKLICKNPNCEVKDCIYHHETLKDYSIPHNVVHLEENPLYCKKANWNRNQAQAQSNESTASH